MIDRTLISTLTNDLQSVPAVVFFGPRQVGKTTLVKELLPAQSENFIYLDLELPSDRFKLSEPELYLKNLESKTIILDEVQFLPGIFPVLRSLIDQNRKPGRFLLLGSASPTLLQQSSESLAGRIRYRELFPFNLLETRKDSLNDLWLKGGFPEAFLDKNLNNVWEWHAAFIRSYTTRDLALLGLAMSPLQIERLLQMLAHQHGNLVNYSNLARSLGVSQPTVTRALYYLEEALLIRTLRPWHTNIKKRLVKTPKVYIRDTGMLHYLLGIDSYEKLLGHPQAGNSWEGFVIQQITSLMPQNISCYFYRTSGGAELDLILVKSDRVWMAIMIKMGTSPVISRGNTESIMDIQPEKQIIVSHNDGVFPLSNAWENFDIYSLMNNLRSKLS